MGPREGDSSISSCHCHSVLFRKMLLDALHVGSYLPATAIGVLVLALWVVHYVGQRSASRGVEDDSVLTVESSGVKQLGIQCI